MEDHNLSEDGLYERAKNRALYLIERREYTCREIRDKLKKGGKYEDPTIDRVLAFLQEYRFVDDRDYACRYIRTYGKSKSRRQIQFELERKGVNRELIRDAMDEQGLDDQDSLERLAQKRLKGKELTPQEKKKQYAYFLGKGYSYDQVRKILDIYGE